MQQWTIFATFPSSIQSQQMGSYGSRACAEQDAIGYRRILGQTVAVRVIWTQKP